jgi:methylenetetrahydrofolate reductase (NADPH)
MKCEAGRGCAGGGIMPITSSSQLLRFSDMCGAEIPRWVRLKLQSW